MIGKKLLVADDSLTIQKVIRLALSNEGYEIQTVSDGNDAVQQIAVFRPDIVLIDIGLPGKSAFEVKSLVENEAGGAQVRFVLMSSAYERVNEAEIETAKFNGRLTKPFDPAHLRKVLSDVLTQATAEREMPEAPQSPPPGEIWDQEGDFIMPPVPPALPPGLSAEFAPPQASLNDLPPIAAPMSETLPPANAQDNDGDIKHLTESTIRMSGLDDFQWSVNEPTMKPPSALTEQDTTTLHVEVPPPPPPQLGQGLPPFEFNSEDTTSSVPSGISLSESYTTGDAASVSREDLEEMVKKHLQSAVEAALEKFAQKTLPDVAEKVIKAEIHKLLSQQG